MAATQGGRITLRLERPLPDRIEYVGESIAPSGRWPLRASVLLADGVVSLQGDGAPEWLLDYARAMLRTAWRSSKTGATWPRRLNRWRDEPASSG